MKTFTVFLLYPDYATGDYGADLYVESAEAEDYKEATTMVQAMAEQANDNIAAEDFRPIAVLEGEHWLVADATSF